MAWSITPSTFTTSTTGSCGDFAAADPRVIPKNIATRKERGRMRRMRAYPSGP